MGAKFTQVIVKGPDQRQLAAYMEAAGAVATVGPTVGGYTILSDEACSGFEEQPMHRLCTDLSRTFECPLLGVHYFDDDVLAYGLYEDGVLTDEYDSCPDYHDFAGEHIPPRPPMGGDVAKLGAAFGLTETQREATRTALHEDISSDLLKGLSVSPEDVMSAFRSGNRTGMEQMIRQMMSEFQQQMREAPPATPDKYDGAFPAQWRFGHLIEAMGVPEYAMHFGYGAEEEMHGLEPGAFIHVG